MGARVVGGGGIGVRAGSLATVVGSRAVGTAADVWTAGALTVAGMTGAG